MTHFLKDYEFAAKYPFSAKAKEIMRIQQNIEVNDFMAECGFERLSAAFKQGFKTKVFLHEDDAIKEMIGYATARMMLAYMHNRFLINKYAIAESKKVFAYLADESKENIQKLAVDIGINSFDENTVDIAHFLLFAPKDVHYKLIARELANGRVPINKHEQIRMIAEAVKKYMEKIPQAPQVPVCIKKTCERLYALLPKIEPQKISFKEGENPPCIESILEMIKKHENVGHTGRWLLAVYLINKGMSTEQILSIFSNAPDYNEKIATYQIEHAKKREYKMPNCSSLISYGYCIAQCKITNPMIWRSLQ